MITPSSEKSGMIKGVTAGEGSGKDQILKMIKRQLTQSSGGGGEVGVQKEQEKDFDLVADVED